MTDTSLAVVDADFNDADAEVSVSIEEQLRGRVLELERELAKLTENGAAKLYYSLQRKSWEMADVLDSNDLKKVSLEDPKDKTFDRLKTLWNDATSLGVAIKSLGEVIGVTGEEERDVKRSFVDTIAERRD